MSNLLEVEHISCRYDSHEVIRDLSFSLSGDHIVSLLGPSGCGKTTVLRAIAGFEPVTRGAITLDGNLLSDPARQLPPESRRVGMVFQDYALFPHLNVRDNIAFGLQDHPASERDNTLASLLKLVQLEVYADVYPHQLSGGQQQRVALARALAPAPKLLLMDEPFSSLDTELRRSLSVEVRNILKARGTGAILVTHDQTEAFNMADAIGVMHDGDLQQWGTPRDLFQSPATPFVAGFICNGKFITGRLGEDGRADTCFGPVALCGHEDITPNTMVQILVRPWELLAAADSSCRGTIIQQQFSGAVSTTGLRLGDNIILESNDVALAGLPLGEDVGLSLAPNLLRCYAIPS